MRKGETYNKRTNAAPPALVRRDRGRVGKSWMGRVSFDLNLWIGNEASLDYYEGY